MIIERTVYKQIKNYLFQGKLIVIYGPRQVGKTTLVKQILAEYWNPQDYYTADDYDIVQKLSATTSTELASFVGDKKLIVIDEAQRIPNIWITLKLLHDFYPGTQIIATGSSSFDLANSIKEPLTWRKYTFHLYPFSLIEIQDSCSLLEHNRLLPSYLQYGMYPEIWLSSQKDKLLSEIKDDYLYKDILSFNRIRKPDIVVRLLQALALQLGSEVSYTELSRTLSVDKKTVEEYISILEQAFIIFRLPSLSRNARNELKKSRKIYFWDTWIRNAVINNLNPLSLRTDSWALWENFCISEKIKANANNWLSANYYFWRTTTQQEIDFIQDVWWQLTAYECKWNYKTTNIPKTFQSAYPTAIYTIVTPENIWSLVS